MRTTRLLLQSGADIREINTVRKHISAIKGGRLAARCRGRIATLVISDVVGDTLEFIASGPTVPDTTSWADARDVLARYSLAASVPVAVARLIEQGVAGERPRDAEDPAREARCLRDRVQHPRPGGCRRGGIGDGVCAVRVDAISDG